MPLRITELPAPEHESLHEFRDDRIGYHAFIAIHSSTPGPATGGTRMSSYASPDAAVADVLRLSRAMSFKAALADLPAGGGKAVILADGIRDRRAVLRRHGEAVESLGGRYVTAVDVGTSTADLAMIGETTSFIAHHRLTGGGDGADTARGVLAAIRALADVRWQTDTLAGMRVAVQGAGNVGGALCRLLRAAGCMVMIGDVIPARARAIADEVEGTVLAADDVSHADADVFAPCAMGGAITPAVAGALRCGGIAGGANNQLTDDGLADVLTRRGIAAVPDYVANAGGLIAGVGERIGLTLDEIMSGIDGIRDRSRRILEEAVRSRRSTLDVANEIATTRLRQSHPAA